MQQRIVALLDASPVDPQVTIERQIARAATQRGSSPTNDMKGKSSAPTKQLRTVIPDQNDPDVKVPAAVRVLMTSEEALPVLQQHATIVKVAPLRVRPSDIKSWIDFLLSKLARAGRGPAKAAQVPGTRRRDVRYVVRPEVYRKLQAYQFPNNLTELKVGCMVVRCVS